MAEYLTDDEVEGWETALSVLSDDDVEGWETLPSSSGTGAVARGAAEGLFPTTGGLAAGLMTTAAMSGASPWVSVPAGLAVGLGAGEALNRGQDWIMEKLGMREGTGNFSRAQQQADEIEHPYLKTAGAAAPSALLLKPTGALIQRGLGAAIGGGVTAADELIREGHIDPGKVAIGAATGFALPTANRAGRAVESFGGRAAPSVTPWLPERVRAAAPEAPPAVERAPLSDDIKLDTDQPWGPSSPYPGQEARNAAFADWDAQQARGSTRMAQPRLEAPVQEGEVLPPDTAGLGLDARVKEWEHNVSEAEYQLSNAAPELKTFWQTALIHAEDNLAKWKRYGAGKGDPTHFVDASLGPAGDEHPFTYADTNRANDLTTTSAGTAPEQSRVSENPNTGNPFGYGGANRIAARTDSPLRNYAKDRLLLEGHTKIDIDRPESPIAEDLQAALGALTPPRPEPKPLTPDLQDKLARIKEKQRTAGHQEPLGQHEVAQIQSGGRMIEGELARPQRALPKPAERLKSEWSEPPRPGTIGDWHNSPDSIHGMDRLSWEKALTESRRMRAPDARPDGTLTPPEVTGAVTPRPTLSLKGRPSAGPQHIAMADIDPLDAGNPMRMEIVNQYRKKLQNGEPVPAVHVVKSANGKYSLWDGQHRYTAHQQEGSPTIKATVMEFGDKGPTRTAGEMKTRGQREVVPERAAPAVTPTDKYGVRPAPKAEGEPVFTDREGEALLKVIENIPKNSENARTGKEDYRGVAKVGEKEVQLGRGEVGKRRKAALDAFTDAVREMPDARFNLDPSKENIAAVLDHATKLFESAKARFGGKDPTERGVGYTPNDKPPEFNLVAAAHTFVKKPTPANMKPYVEALALKGKIGKKDYTGKDTHKVEFTDAVEADFKPSESREEIEPYVSTGERGVAYDREQHALRDWVGELTNDEWAALDGFHEGDLAMTVKTTQNPDVVLKQLRNELSHIAVKSRRALDTPERIADAEAETKGLSREEEIAKLLGEQKADAQLDTENSESARPITKGLKNALNEFLHGDAGEGGFLDIFQIGRDLKALASRLMSSTAGRSATITTPYSKTTININGGAPAAPTAPAATAATPTPAQASALFQGMFTRVKNAAMEYGKAVMIPSFAALNSRKSLMKRRIQMEIAAATKTPLTAAEQEQLYRAREDGTVASLPQHIQDYNTSYVEPRFQESRQDYEELVRLSRLMGVQGADKLKDIKNNGAGFKNHMPHVSYDAVTPKTEYDYIAGTMSPWAAHAQTREYHTLQNAATGERLLYHLDPRDADHITILRNGAPQAVKVGSLDMAAVGTDLPLKVKGVSGTWKVDYATPREIRANAGRNPDGTPKVDYIENAHAAVIHSHANIRMALENLRTLKKFIEDPDFNTLVTADRGEAERKGWLNKDRAGGAWVQHQALPQFKDWYMPPAFDWHLADYVHRGFLPTASLSAGQARLEAAISSSAKIFYMVGGPVHAFNVFDKWAIGRGKDWVTGWKGLAKFPEAIKSVLSQDPTQHELGQHGMNMLYLHTITQHALPDAMRALGVDMTRNAWRWDPFAKQFGITTPQMVNKLLNKNSAGLWWFSDVLATQRYLELKGQGLSPKDAVAKLKHSADDYLAQATYGSEGPGGRMVQKVLTSPILSWFAAFHQHNFHMLGRMASGLLGPKATLSERADAAAQIALLGGMMSLVYPALSAGYASLTGNKHSEFEERGLSRVAGTGRDIIRGRKGMEDALRNVWTPSSATDTAVRLFQNKRFDDKHIVNHTDMRDWRNVPKAAGQLAEFGAQQYASPYKLVSTAATRPGATPGSVAGRFAEAMFGFKTPTPRAVMREAKTPITQRREQMARDRNPTGVLESAINRATKRSYGQ